MLNIILKVLEILEIHLDIILTIAGFLFAWYTYRKEKKDRDIRKLAKQVIAFYCLEQEAMKMIHEVTGEPEQTIQRKLRKQAVDNNENIEGVRPEMTAVNARKYL